MIVIITTTTMIMIIYIYMYVCIYICWRICFSDCYGLGYSRWMAMLFPPPRKLAAILTRVNERKFKRGEIEKYMAKKS
jgi:hypothetical protein